MSPEERTLLTRFLQDLNQSRGGLKDAEAAGLIDQTIRTNPDAAYLLVQHAILSDQALHAAQAHIAELEGRSAAGATAGQGGFLGGSGAGYRNAGPPPSGPWGQPAPAQPSYSPPPQAPRSGLFGGGPAQPGGFGSFLRSAGTTAAGVAGGAFLFDSLSGLFGGHRGFGGGMGGWGGGGFGGPVENVTINEYGDQSSGDPGYDDSSGFDNGGGGGYDDGGVN